MHELSFQNGQAEAIYSGEKTSVWHRLGKYFGKIKITLDDLKKCVGIPVSKVSTTYQRPVSGGSDTVEVQSKKAYLTVRTDTWEELASVGPDYEVVQHDTALVEAIAPIIDAGYATIDAAGLLRQGLGGWSLLKWELDRFDPIVREVYGNEIQAYGLCLSWHGEGNANSYANVTERAVCKNTIDIGMASATLKTRVRHTKNANIRQAEAARETFKYVVAHHKSMAEAYAKLKQTKLDRELWIELVQKVAMPNPKDSPTWNENAPRAAIVYERFREKANRVYDLWRHGTGHTGDKSAWEAYNGLVESMDHDKELWRAHSEENRVLSLTDGPLAKTRAAVFNSLLAYASK